MKAIVYEKYGSPDELKLQDVEMPTPKNNEVLIKVQAASLNAADWHLLRADPFMARFFSGLFKPKFKILGADVAGTVAAVGADVSQFKVGDEVFGDLFGSGLGGFAEYVCASESALVLKPAALSFEAAAAIPMAAVTALQGLRDQGKIQAGQKVLINGASGGVGTFAIQLAKIFGAVVTAVCSTPKLELARSLGADYTVDYTQEDFTQNGQKYDLILAVNGFHSLSDYARALSPQGQYVMIGGSNAQIFQALLQAPFKSLTSQKKMGALSTKTTQADLMFLNELVRSKKMRVIIDQHYPLSETVQAFKYLEKGRAKGKIVIIMKG